MSNLIPEVRADVNGKLVTRHVKSVSGAGTAKNLPAPALTTPVVRQRKRTAFKPSERQLRSANYGVPMDVSNDPHWDNIANRPTSPELLAVPMTPRQQEKFQGNYHRFEATELEYYSVLTVARPWDAINLLHRDIRDADTAREFLSEHGLDHLAGDNSEYVDEFLRKRVQPNVAASYLDKIIDYGADPKNAMEWVEACSMRSIAGKAEVLDQEMLSGTVTLADLKQVGLKNAGVNMKAVGEAIAVHKTEGNQNLSMENIASLAEIEFESKQYNRWSGNEENNTASLEARLAVCRYRGLKDADGWLNLLGYEWKRDTMRAAGSSDGEKLADYTLYASKLGAGFSSQEYFTAIDRLFEAGIDPQEARKVIRAADYHHDEAIRLLDAALESVPSSVSSGWL